MKRVLVGMGVACGLLGLPLSVEAQGYVGARDVPFGAARVLEAMGDRLQVTGKERLDLFGVLTRAGEDPRSVHILWEYPGKVRIEQPVQTGVEDEDSAADAPLIYDGAGTLHRSGGRVTRADQDLIEMLVHDSVEGFFIGQLEGFATRFLGNRYHRVDAEGNAVGPDYDIYEVTNEVRVAGRRLRQRKLYYFDSDTALLGKVRYRLAAERGRGEVEVSVEVSGWSEVFGQLIPGKMVRYEDGGEVVKLEINEAGVAPAAEDSSFTVP